MKNLKKVAMALYKKAYFSKEKDIVNIELVKRQFLIVINNIEKNSKTE